jgi:hypothetical protein
MATQSTENEKGLQEKAVRALYEHLRAYYFGRRIPWMHDMLGNDYHKGEAHALISLVLIPEIRAALDAIDKNLGRDLARWDDTFQPPKSE